MAAATQRASLTYTSTAATPTTRAQVVISSSRNPLMEDHLLQQQYRQEQQGTITVTMKQHCGISNENKKKDRSNRRMESIQILQGYLSQNQHQHQHQHHHQQQPSQSQQQQQQQLQQSQQQRNESSLLHQVPIFPSNDGTMHTTKNSVFSYAKNLNKNSSAGDVETDQLLNDILFQTTATTMSVNGNDNGNATSPDLNQLMFTSIGSTNSGTNYNYNQLLFQSMGSMHQQDNVTNSPTTTDQDMKRTITTVIDNTNNYSNSIGNQEHVAPDHQYQQPMTVMFSKSTSSNGTNNLNTATRSSYNERQRQRSLSISSLGNNSNYFSSSMWKPTFQPNHIELMEYPPDQLFFDTTGSNNTTTTIQRSNTTAAANTDTLLLAAQHVLHDDNEDDSTTSITATANGYTHDDMNASTVLNQKAGHKAVVGTIKAAIKTKNSAIQQEQEPSINRRRKSTRSSTVKTVTGSSKGKLKDHVAESHVELDNNVVTKPTIGVNDSLQLQLQQQQQQQLTGVVDGRIVPLISNLEVTNDDVLLGRGGRTNHHIGNRTYRTLKEELQTTYLQATKDEKTVIANQLVQKIHDANGRFLKEFTGTPLPSTSTTVNNPVIVSTTVLYWYEVDVLTARKKASQTLREINTPENRLAKRLKYNGK